MFNGRVAFTGRLFHLTNEDPRLFALQAKLVDIVSPTIDHMGYELVRLLILGRERPTVQIMVERQDGKPMGVADCEALSYALGPVIDVADPMPDAWTLEVSSPGIDRPLVRVKDWNRFAGHLAQVELAAPIAGRKRFSGIVLGADETMARLRLDDETEISLPLASIRRAKLVLTEALIAATAEAPQSN